MEFNKSQLVDLLQGLNLKRENLAVLLEYIERKDNDGIFSLINTPKKLIVQLETNIGESNRWGKHPSTPTKSKQRHKRNASQLVGALKELLKHYKSGFLGLGTGSFR